MLRLYQTQSKPSLNRQVLGEAPQGINKYHIISSVAARRLYKIGCTAAAEVVRLILKCLCGGSGSQNQGCLTLSRLSEEKAKSLSLVGRARVLWLF